MGSEFCPLASQASSHVAAASTSSSSVSSERAAFPALMFRSDKNVSQTLSYEAADRLTDSLAAEFAAHLQQVKSPRVALLAPNSIKLALAIFALRRAGRTPVPLNIRMTAQDWEAQLGAAHAEALIGADSLLDQAPRTLASLSLEELFAAAESKINSSNTPAAPYQSNREAAVLFTSATTGAGKGVVLSLESVRASARGSNACTGLSQGDRWLVSLPLYHAGGLSILQRCFEAGATAVIAQSFAVSELLESIARDGLTHVSLVPTMLGELIAEAELQDALPQLHGLKAIVLAGAPTAGSLIAKIKELRLPVLTAYGMTETNAHCTCLARSDSPDAIDSVGRPFESTLIEIVGEGGAVLPQGELGEIAISGPTLLTEYLDPEQTKAHLRGGRFYTGDLGRLDAAGRLTLFGRADRMFISGGENIYPEEIEQAASQCAGIAKCAVVAVPHPKWGHRPVLFIECSEPGVSPDELLAFLRGTLAKFKVPDRVVQIPLIPLKGIGKVDYAALARLADDFAA